MSKHKSEDYKISGRCNHKLLSICSLIKNIYYHLSVCVLNVQRCKRR